MLINQEVLKKVAKNSRLNLSESEIGEFTPQLRDVLEFFEKLKNVPQAEVSIHPTNIENVYREDVVENSLHRDEALKNVKYQSNGRIRGPRTI